MGLRSRLHAQLDPAARRKPGLSPLNLVLVGMILLSTVVAIIATEPLAIQGNEHFFALLEIGFACSFVFEYAARLWTCVEEPRFSKSLTGRLRFVATPGALLDLIVVFASLAPFLTGNLFPLRLLRLVGIIRFAKLGRMSTSMRHLATTVAERRYELLLTLMLAGFVVIASATAMWWVEGDAQPDKFGSIPRAMWWAAVTLTTIGYGDVFPVTAAGKLLSVAVALSGIGLIAMPTGILAAAFSDAMQRERESLGRNPPDHPAAPAETDPLPASDQNSLPSR